jgi:hypothetical protein
LEPTDRIKNWVWLLPPATLALLVLPFVQWGGSDDDVFILGVLNGTPYPPPVSPTNGRFWPLGHQEWRAFPKMSEAWMFHLVAIIEYSVFCFVLTKLMAITVRNPVDHVKVDRGLIGGTSLSVFLFLSTLSPVVIAFSMIVGTERNILLLFLLWLVFYTISIRRNDVMFGLMSVICAIIACYFKEPTFLFFGGFSIVGLWNSPAPKQETNATLKSKWREIGFAISAVVFITFYLYYVGLSSIMSGTAYHGSNVAISKIIPAIERWALTEPLVIPLLLLGLILPFVGALTKKANSFELFGLWLGSFFYFFILVLMGLTSKYYAALPMLGFAIYVCMVLNNFGWLCRLNVLFGLLVVANMLTWIPVIIRKHDYAHRSVELVNKLLELFPPTEARPPTFVLVRDGDGWQAQMLIIYADHIRKTNFQFYCDHPYDVYFYYDNGDAICRRSAEEVARGVTVELYQSAEEGMSARLFVDGHEIWRYISVWERIVPFFLRNLFASQIYLSPTNP